MRTDPDPVFPQDVDPFDYTDRCTQCLRLSDDLENCHGCQQLLCQACWSSGPAPSPNGEWPFCEFTLTCYECRLIDWRCRECGRQCPWDEPWRTSLADQVTRCQLCDLDSSEVLPLAERLAGRLAGHQVQAGRLVWEVSD